MGLLFGWGRKGQLKPRPAASPLGGEVGLHHTEGSEH